MIKLKSVGIRKNNSWHLPVFIIINVSLIVATIVFWLFYNEEYKYKHLLEKGVEVEATIVSYDYHSASHGVDGDTTDTSSGWYYIWECYFNGNRYRGTSGNNYFRTEEQVSEYIGDKFTVTVDPDSTFAVAKPLSGIRANGFYFKEYFTCAIVFTCLTPIAAVTSTWFILYPLILNYKNDRCGKLPIESKVTKVRGWLIKYVKVHYKYNGEICERWTRQFFTIREAKFLEQKRIINIVPYKNTFGIVEEMRIEKINENNVQ